MNPRIQRIYDGVLSMRDFFVSPRKRRKVTVAPINNDDSFFEKNMSFRLCNPWDAADKVIGDTLLAFEGLENGKR